MAIDIYQIGYSGDVNKSPDGFFHSYDCTADPAWDKREIFHMHRFHAEGRHLKSEISGLVSPKFSGKTGITGSRFIEFIETNPGYDVYFINPFPHLAYLSFNVWEQGEFWHDDLCRLASLLFATSGYDLDVSNLPRNKADTLLYSNYWVANHNFWDRYMRFIGKLMDGVDKLPVGDRSKFFSIAAHSTAATYYPFVFERMFSTFLLMERSIKFLAYPWSRTEVLERCETEGQALVVREWGDMIDRWDAADTYTSDQRLVFSSLMKIGQLSGARSPARDTKLRKIFKL